MLEQPRLFHNNMTTDYDSECSYVINLVDFNVIRVIKIAIMTVPPAYKAILILMTHNTEVMP